MMKHLNKWVRFSKKFPYVQIKKRNRASLIIVKDLSNMCVTDAERLLYDRLRDHAYYPTPHHLLNGIKINLALVPYKLALIEVRPGMNVKRMTRLLKKRDWSIVFYDAEQLIENEQSYVNLVMKYAPTYTKDVSTS